MLRLRGGSGQRLGSSVEEKPCAALDPVAALQEQQKKLALAAAAAAAAGAPPPAYPADEAVPKGGAAKAGVAAKTPKTHAAPEVVAVPRSAAAKPPAAKLSRPEILAKAEAYVKAEALTKAKHLPTQAPAAAAPAPTAGAPSTDGPASAGSAAAPPPPAVAPPAPVASAPAAPAPAAPAPAAPAPASGGEASPAGNVGHQGSDPNAKDPTGIWSSFQKIGGEPGGAVGSGLRTVCFVFGQASCRRRSQSDVTLRISTPKTEFSIDDLDTLSPESFKFLDAGNGSVTAVCTGKSFCGLDQHHILCQCTPGPEIPRTEVCMSRAEGSSTMLTGQVSLPPGQYQVKFWKNGEGEVLKGMWGEEEYRPLTVLPPPKKDAPLLMSDIDGTLLAHGTPEGEEDATGKFFWIWNEQYRPRGAHLVYNTGRPFPSAHNLIKENRLHPPTVLVCSEGTEIYWFGPFGAEDVEPDYEWREILMLSWDYPKIKAGVQMLVEQMQHEVNDVQYLPDVNGQPMIVINVPDKGKADNMIGKIDYELRKSQHLPFDMTCSSGGGNFFILLIPKGASKGSAALHVSKRLGFRSEQVMVAGDGENDVPLFEATKEGFKGAIVGNAVEGLKSWVSRSPSRSMIHRSMSQQALGVLEGLSHHFPAAD